jgi:hypothetical protein
MGWTFTDGQKRAELIAERAQTREWAREKTGERVKDVVLAHCFRGGRFSGTFYAVHERTVRDGGKETERERWIEVTLMKCYGGSWGYKDMEETMGPCEISCPLGYLDMVPEPQCTADCPKDGHGHVWARNWRGRAYHAERAAQRQAAAGLKVGDTVKLKEGCTPPEIVVVQVKPLRGEYDGRVYRVKPTHLVVQV